jgi:hypothetical protein
MSIVIDLSMHSRSAILLDTNLFVVLAVAWVNPDLVGHVKRTEGYTRDDAEAIERICRQFKRRVTTPAILAEVTNLLDRFVKDLSPDWELRLKQSLLAEISVLDERYIPARQMMADEALLKFGFTDVAIAAIAASDVLVLTTDVMLTGLLAKRKLPCINYNHHRQT